MGIPHNNLIMGVKLLISVSNLRVHFNRSYLTTCPQLPITTKACIEIQNPQWTVPLGSSISVIRIANTASSLNAICR